MNNYRTNIQHSQKRVIQGKIFPLINSKTVYGLAGPSVNEYGDLFSNQVDKIISYERDDETFKNQYRKLSHSKIELRKGNITKAPLDCTAFYDLDLMGLASSCGNVINRFKDQSFLITLVNGRCKDKFKLVFEALEEKLVSFYDTTYNLSTGNITKSRIITNKNRYYFEAYKDTCAMFMLYKIPNKYYINDAIQF